jgi:hypothetical protein
MLEIYRCRGHVLHSHQEKREKDNKQQYLPDTQRKERLRDREGRAIALCQMVGVGAK